jgi:hypothetical protein
VDYPWSSYPVYAHGKKSPEWLRTAPILSHFDIKDKNRAYRDMVQVNHESYAGKSRFDIHSTQIAAIIRAFGARVSVDPADGKTSSVAKEKDNSYAKQCWALFQDWQAICKS